MVANYLSGASLIISLFTLYCLVDIQKNLPGQQRLSGGYLIVQQMIPGTNGQMQQVTHTFYALTNETSIFTIPATLGGRTPGE